MAKASLPIDDPVGVTPSPIQFEASTPIQAPPITRAQAPQGLAEGWKPVATAPVTAPAPDSRTWADAGKDAISSFGLGAAGLAQNLGDIGTLVTGDPNNAFSRSMARTAQDATAFYNPMRSDKLNAELKSKNDAIYGAKKENGEWGALGETLKQNFKSPDLLADFLIRQAPLLGVAGAGGIAAKVGSTLLGFTTANAVRAGVAGAVGTAAVQQGADVGGDVMRDLDKPQTPEAIREAAIAFGADLKNTPRSLWLNHPRYLELTAQGMSEEQAKQQVIIDEGRKVATLGGLISIAAQFIPGGRTLERAMVGGALRGDGIKGIVGGAIKGAIGGGLSESVEEGGGKLAANWRYGGVDPSRPLTDELGNTIGEAATGGMLMGGVAGTAHGSHPDVQPQVQPDSGIEPNLNTGTQPPAPNAPSLPPPNTHADWELADELPANRQPQIKLPYNARWLDPETQNVIVAIDGGPFMLKSTAKRVADQTGGQVIEAGRGYGVQPTRSDVPPSLPNGSAQLSGSDSATGAVEPDVSRPATSPSAATSEVSHQQVRPVGEADTANAALAPVVPPVTAPPVAAPVAAIVHAPDVKPLETYAGIYKKGLTEPNAATAARAKRREQPRLDWSVEHSQELSDAAGSDRYVVKGYPMHVAPTAPAAVPEPVVSAQKTPIPPENTRSEATADIHPDIAHELRYMAQNAGWAQRGGSIIRKTNDFNHPDYNTITGRTQWIPNQQWYQDLTERLPPAETKAAVEKYLTGGKLKAKERRVVEDMLSHAQSHVDERSNPGQTHWVDEESQREAQLEREAIQAESAIAEMSDEDINALIEAAQRDQGQVTDRTIDAVYQAAESVRRAQSDEAGTADASTAEGSAEARPFQNPLSTYTAGEIRQKQSLLQRAEKALTQRNNAPDSKDFTLSGSDRGVDEAEARGQKPLLSVSTLGSRAVRNYIESHLAPRFAKAGVKLRVVDTVEELPADARKSGVEGFYDPKTDIVTLVAENLTKERATWVALHEWFGHRGLEGLRKEGNVDARLRELNDTKTGKALAEAIKAERSDEFEGLSKNAADLLAAEEAAAELIAAQETGNYQHIEDRYGVKVGSLAAHGLRVWVNKVVDAVKAAISKLTGVSFDSVRIRNLLRDMKRASGASVPTSAARSLFSKAPPLMSEAFKAWFGNSKVVDKEGKPLVVYHGTDKAFNKFNPKKAIGGQHWFTTDRAAIERNEVGAAGKGRIIDAYLSIQKPAGWKEYDNLTIDELIGRGYDGIELPEGDHKVFVAFNPTQIKSASKNNGQFDANNPDIRFSRAPKATTNREILDIDKENEISWNKLGKKAVDYVDRKLDVLGDLPDNKSYLKERYLALGQIANADAIAKTIRDAFHNTTDLEKKQVYDYLTTRGAVPTSIANEKLRAAAAATKANINEVSKRLVSRGLLSEESREEYRDMYLPRLYLKHMLSEADSRALGTGKKPSDMGYLKARKDIPEDVRKVILGEITDPAFLAAMAITRPLRDVALLDFLEKISNAKNGWTLDNATVDWKGKRVTPMWLMNEADRLREQAQYMKGPDAGKARAVADQMESVGRPAMEELKGAHTDYKQVPDTPRYGRLRGLWVRKEIYQDIVGVYDIMPNDPNWAQSIFGYGGIGTKVTQWWKMGKVTLNPASQIRNAVSNAVMLQLSGVSLHMVPVRIFQAVKQITSNGKYWQVAKKYGVTEATFNAQELGEIKRDAIQMQAESMGDHSMKRMGLAAMLMIHPIVEKAGNAYQFMEQVGKVAKIIDVMEKAGAKKNKSADWESKAETNAALEAQKWLYDYSLVPQWVRYARSAPIGSPFLTYTFKSVPRLIEVAALHPHRLIPWVGMFAAMPYLAAMMVGGDPDDWKRVKKMLPEFQQKRGHFAAMPYRDEAGRIQFADWGPYFPWTMWSDAINNTARGEVGEAAGDLAGGLFGGGPLFSILATLTTGGVDPFTDRKVFNEGDSPTKQMADWMSYAWTLAMPPIVTDQGFAGKMHQAITGSTNKYGDSRAVLSQALLNIIGLNASGINPESVAKSESARMWHEMEQAKIRTEQRLQDQALTKTQRESITEEGRAEITRRAQKLQDYRKDAQVPEALKVHKPQN